MMKKKMQGWSKMKKELFVEVKTRKKISKGSCLKAIRKGDSSF